MRVRESDQLTWLDGLILAAAVLGGVAAGVSGDGEFVASVHGYRNRMLPWPHLPAWVRKLELQAKRSLFDFNVYLLPVSLGIGVVVFRRRDAWRWRGLRKPGVAAAGAACAVVLVSGITALGLSWSRRHSQFSTAFSWVHWWQRDQFEPAVTAAILGVWSYLVLARSWRARRDWSDWLGRWLAWSWLSSVGFEFLFVVLWG